MAIKSIMSGTEMAAAATRKRQTIGDDDSDESGMGASMYPTAAAAAPVVRKPMAPAMGPRPRAKAAYGLRRL